MLFDSMSRHVLFQLLVAAACDFFCAQPRASMREKVRCGTQLGGTIVVVVVSRVAAVLAVVAVAGGAVLLVTVRLLLVVVCC